MKTLLLVLILPVLSIPTILAAPDSPDDISPLLKVIREKHRLPALGAIAIVDGEIKALGAVGMRKFNGKESVTIDDKWHIGSCTKSMTATLAATFVEEGKIKWDSTVSEVFGEKIKLRPDYHQVTLGMLLSNRSGIPGLAPPKIWAQAWSKTGQGDILMRRKQYVEAMLQTTPDFEPGTRYAYSNSGFVVAGVMLETITGKSWEDLMKERIFNPLKMSSAGFGSAAMVGKEDQPWGHHSPKKPQEPGVAADNPDVIGPAGTVHVSLGDLARYARMHSSRETGVVLKRPETFQFLHSIADGNEDYARGWVRLKRGWANGDALMHNGSNTLNYCVIWLAPERGGAGIAVSNIGETPAAPACDEAVSALIQTYLK